ncbi:MAG: hypothetical protein ABI112_12890, partial [Terracoccus sp.]
MAVGDDHKAVRMGRNNQARRRMKASARTRGGSGAAPAGASFRRDEPQFVPPAFDGAHERAVVTHLLQEALDAIDYRRGEDLDDVAVGLAGRCSDPRVQRTVVGVLLESMTTAVTAAWQRGWQPADVQRLAGRRLPIADQALVVDAMSHELNRYAASTIDPHWLAQLSELEGGIWWPSSVTWIDARRAQGADWLTLVLGCLAAWHLLVRLPTLEQLTPLPGEAVHPPEASSAGAGDAATEQPVVDERVLSRVRLLLAKA